MIRSSFVCMLALLMVSAGCGSNKEESTLSAKRAFLGASDVDDHVWIRNMMGVEDRAVGLGGFGPENVATTAKSCIELPDVVWRADSAAIPLLSFEGPMAREFAQYSLFRIQGEQQRLESVIPNTDLEVGVDGNPLLKLTPELFGSVPRTGSVKRFALALYEGGKSGPSRYRGCLVVAVRMTIAPVQAEAWSTGRTFGSGVHRAAFNGSGSDPVAVIRISNVNQIPVQSDILASLTMHSTNDPMGVAYGFTVRPLSSSQWRIERRIHERFILQPGEQCIVSIYGALLPPAHESTYSRNFDVMWSIDSSAVIGDKGASALTPASTLFVNN